MNGWDFEVRVKGEISDVPEDWQIDWKD